MQHRTRNPFPLLVAGAGLCLVALTGCATGGGSADDPTITTRPVEHSATATPTPTVSTGPTTSPSSTASTGGSAAGGSSTGGSAAGSPVRCDVGQLRGATTKDVHTDIDIDIPVTVTNTGGTTCTIQGWPGVSFVAGSKQIGPAGVLDRSTPHPTVTLQPGGQASFVVHVIRPDDYSNAVCAPRLIDGMRIIPPGSTKSLFVEAPGYDACSSDLPTTIHIGAIVPGAAS